MGFQPGLTFLSAVTAHLTSGSVSPLFRHPSQQIMDSPAECATMCAMPTAYETSHLTTSMLHPHHTDGRTTMAYTGLNFYRRLA